jgi:CRP-like cAMP-binding protein
VPISKRPLPGLGTSTNRLIQALSPKTRESLRPALERVKTTSGDVLASAEAPIHHFFFVERGMISLVKSMRDGRTIEIGAVGVEGLDDPSGIFDSDRAILESIVQIPGQALRIKRADLRKQVAENRELMRLMHGYVRLALSQIAQTTACNCLHSLEQRCCRWLLVASDSALAESFSLTQQFLSMMLGVSRTSISLTARLLQRAGLIRYVRGIVTIENRQRLEARACECYATIRSQRDTFFTSGRMRRT